MRRAPIAEQRARVVATEIDRLVALGELEPLAGEIAPLIVRLAGERAIRWNRAFAAESALGLAAAEDAAIAAWEEAEAILRSLAQRSLEPS